MRATSGHKLLANIEYASPIIIVPIYGLTNENASNAWAPIVTAVDKKHHITFLPVLSTMYPQIGLATAAIEYIIEFTKFASSGEKSYFRSKNTLNKRNL